MTAASRAARAARYSPERHCDDDSPRSALLHGISKHYPTVVANDRIDLSVAPGEIHALLGENGAGKSTLMKIVYGVTRPDAGRIEWEGRHGGHSQPGAMRASSASAWCSSTSRCSKR